MDRLFIGNSERRLLSAASSQLASCYSSCLFVFHSTGEGGGRGREVGIHRIQFTFPLFIFQTEYIFFHSNSFFSVIRS